MPTNYSIKQFENLIRVDIILDRYLQKSSRLNQIKNRYGCRLTVKKSTPIRRNWNGFLRVDENESHLYHFLADRYSRQENSAQNI